MSAESGGPAAQNGVERLPVRPAETHPGAFEKRRPGGADDVGHLQRRRTHGGLRGLGLGGRKRVERARGGLQMPVRKVQVDGGRLQVAMPQQKLDGA
jgi:hypothetical protein